LGLGLRLGSGLRLGLFGEPPPGVVPAEREVAGRDIPEREGRVGHDRAQAGHDAAVRLGPGEGVQGLTALPG
jgi:hypothetical protein